MSDAKRRRQDPHPAQGPAGAAGTARTRAPRGKGQAGQRYQPLLDLAPDAMVVADNEGRICAVNRQTEVLFGYARAALVGQPVEQLFPECALAAQQQHRHAFPAAPSTRPMGINLALEGRHRDGREFPVEVSLAPLQPDEGDAGQIIASIRDVSEVQRAQATNRELRLMQALTDTALAHLKLDELLPNLLARVRDVMAVDNVVIRLLAADGQELRVMAAHGPDAAIATELPVPMSEGFSGRIAASGTPLIVDDLPTFLSASPAIDPRLYAQLQSALGVPLVVGERVLGVLHVSTREPHQFTEHDVQLLQRVAERVAIAVERAQLFEAEQAARQEAERERIRWLTAMDSVPEFVITCDAALRRTYVNPAYERLRGGPADPLVPEEELSSRYGLFLPDGKTFFPAPQLPLTRAVSEGQPVHGIEMVLFAPGGQARLVVWESAPMYSAAGELLGAISIGHDITERRQLEREREMARAQAERQAEELDRLVETFADGVVVYDTDERVVRTNAIIRRLLGAEAVTAAAQQGDVSTTSPYYVVHGADGRPLAPENLPLRRVLRGEQLTGSATVDLLVHTPDGHDVELTVSGTPLHDRNGRQIGAACVYHDQTERNRLLREREQARTSELAAQQVTQQLDQFLAVASHDIRTPVTTLSGNLELAHRFAQRLAGTLEAHGTPERQVAQRLATALERADESSLRLSRLVALLFDTTGARLGTLTVSLAPCDLVGLVREQVAAVQQTVSGRLIQVDLPGAAVVVEADADRLGQVLTNYLTNALKYSAADQPVAVRVEQRDGRAIVSVHDHGPGLPVEEQRRVWELYYRAPGVVVQNTVGAASGSLGMGLYVCQRLVELHPGGQVGVNSTVGEGSTFWFSLPLAHGDP